MWKRSTASMTVWFCSCFYSYLFLTYYIFWVSQRHLHTKGLTIESRLRLIMSDHGSRVSPCHAIICHQIPSTLSQIPSLQSFLADLRSRSPSMSRKRSRAPHRTLEELLKFMLASLHCFTPRISTTWKLFHGIISFIALRIHIFPPISHGILSMLPTNENSCDSAINIGRTLTGFPWWKAYILGQCDIFDKSCSIFITCWCRVWIQGPWRENNGDMTCLLCTLMLTWNNLETFKID